MKKPKRFYPEEFELKEDRRRAPVITEEIKEIRERAPIIEDRDPEEFEYNLKMKKGGVIETTKHLQEVIAEALAFVPPNMRKEAIKKSCQRSFQALRIEVNDEFGVLDKFLEKLPASLASGGRVAILSFHSGEDRRVKKLFQHLFREGIYSYIAPDPIRPTAEESNTNPRARSAKLRWAIKK